jgi:DNA-binding Xre family transcriptional regulator
MNSNKKLEDKIIFNIKRLMKYKNISQKYLADMLGFSAQMMSLLLSKQRKLNLEHIDSICKALDVEMFELII